MKNAVITGATRGIGKALSYKLASCGFNLALCARNPDQLSELTANITQDYPNSRIIYQSCDISYPENVQSFASFLKSQGFIPSALINNAGVFVQNKMMHEEAGSLEKLMAVNLFGAYYLTRELIPGMIKMGSGTVVNVCSVASLKGYPNAGSYAISKHALLGFSRSLREELKPHNIRVTAVLPGATLTESWDKTQLPDKRFIKAEDVAETIACCLNLSDQSVVEEIIIRPGKGDIPENEI